jgi:hypothetical protein
MVTAAIRLNDFDQAFELGRKALTQYPDHMLVMAQLATIASNQLLMGNKKFAEEGESYAHKAMDMLVANKLPMGYMPDSWQPLKKNLIGDMYQSLGTFALMSNQNNDAVSNLMHASELHPCEPYTYFLLAKAQIRLYQSGERKPVVLDSTALNQPQTLADQIIMTYARATVLTEPEQYKPLRAAIDYDIQMLGKIKEFGPTLQTELARSIESVRGEMSSALAAKPQ